MQQELADNVNQRLEKAVQELQEKHRTGTNEIDDPDRAPTGAIYKHMAAQKQQQQQIVQAQMQQLSLENDGHENANTNNNDSDDDDDEFDDLLDDPALDDLREQRLHKLQQQHSQQLHWKSLGHGQYRRITQDEFLPECNTDGHVCIHFGQSNFEASQQMERLLRVLATQYLECKFVWIEADKAPFFVSKFRIQTLPTLLIFHQGKLTKRLVGFEGIVMGDSPIDKIPSWRLAQWLYKEAQALDAYKGPLGEEKEALLQQKAQQQQRTVYRGLYDHHRSGDDDDGGY